MLTATTQPAPSMRRFVLRALIAVAIVAVVLGTVQVVLARFSATRTSSTSTVSSGQVTLSSNATATCAVTNMLPGSAPSPCTLTAIYSGSVPAYMALDILIETQAGNGGTKLYSPADSTHDLQVAVASTNPSVAAYTIPATATSCPAGAPANSTCYELDNELVSLSAFAAAPPNSTVTFTTTVSLPASTTTGYRGGAAQVVLKAHATQAGNNSTSGCTAGQNCTAVQWS
jgi:hypothetical protein